MTGIREILGDPITTAIEELRTVAQYKLDDPNPGPLTVEDGQDLMKLADALENGSRRQIRSALEVDTAVRENIPDAVWNLIVQAELW